MKIRIDRSLCEGLGNCVVVGPEVVKLDNENKAVIVDTSKASDDKLMEIAESCPLNAIIVEDEKGNQVYP